MIKVELIYIDLHQQLIQMSLQLQSGANVAEAINTSGIHASHPETKEMSVGIYAKKVSLDTVLKDGDRVEIYRPLILDPKEKRRQRARLSK